MWLRAAAGRGPEPLRPPSGCGPTHEWRTLYPEPTAVAGIGASELALRDPEVDLTQRLIGASAGLLVDLGFQVCPIGAITSGMLPASLLVWVAGETTTQRESEQLSSFNVPGVWIGSEAEAVDGWACIEPGVFGDRAQFVRQLVAAVASLVEQGQFLEQSLHQAGVGCPARRSAQSCWQHR
jgi:hypothetical protein